MQEDWREVGNGYLVSSFGRVIGISGKMIKGRPGSNGYLRIQMKDGDRYKEAYVHRLVCRLFVGEQPSGQHEVDHINKNRADNRANNLRWVTKSENLAHRDIRKGSSHGNAKLNESLAKKIRSPELAHVNNKQLARLLGVSRETIRDTRNRKVWKHVA